MANKNILTRNKKKKAQALFKANRLTEAQALYQQICSLDPVDPEAWEMLGLITWQTGQKEEAASCFRKAVTLSPDFAEAHYNLGKAHKVLGRAGSTFPLRSGAPASRRLFLSASLPA